LIIAISVVVSLPFFSYQWNLFMHILGAIVFLGNIIVTAMWMMLAKRSKNPDNLRFAARSVIATDVCFTTPGIVPSDKRSILSSGWFKSGHASWIWVALGIFMVSRLRGLPS